MKSIGDLFKELGFNAEAEVSTQKAFVRNLIKQAQEVSRPLPLKPTEKPDPRVGEQLSFDIEDNVS